MMGDEGPCLVSAEHNLTLRKDNDGPIPLIMSNNNKVNTSCPNGKACLNK